MLPYTAPLRVRLAAVIRPRVSRYERAPAVIQRAYPDLIFAGQDSVDQHDPQGIQEVFNFEIHAPVSVDQD